jgi:hypothetical protein
MHLVNVLPVDGHFAGAGGARDQFVHPVDTAQVGGLTAAGGPHDGNDLVAWNINVDIFDDMIGTE